MMTAAASTSSDASKQRVKPSRWDIQPEPKPSSASNSTPAGYFAHTRKVTQLTQEEGNPPMTKIPKPFTKETSLEKEKTEQPTRKRKAEELSPVEKKKEEPAFKRKADHLSREDGVEQHPKRAKFTDRKFTIPQADHKISTMSNKDRPYIIWLAQGVKAAEGRINIPLFQKMKVGQTVCFHNRFQYVLCKISFLHTYKGFREMLEKEGVKKMLPFARTIEEGIKVYQSFPGASRVSQFGAVAIGVEPLKYRLSHDEDEKKCEPQAISKKNEG